MEGLLLVILKGIAMGITLSFVTGPAMFALMQTSLTSGFKSGVRFAIGISISDIIMVFLVLFGVSALLDTPRYKMIFAIVGGIVMIFFGIFTFMQKVKTDTGKSIKPQHVLDAEKEKHRIKRRIIKILNALKFTGKGFLFNIANPGVWFYWTVPVSVAIALGSTKSSVIFMIALLATTLSCDVLKCAIAYKLKTILVPKVIQVINRIVGVALIVFGVYLAISEFVSLDNILQK